MLDWRGRLHRENLASMRRKSHSSNLMRREGARLRLVNGLSAMDVFGESIETDNDETTDISSSDPVAKIDSDSDAVVDAPAEVEPTRRLPDCNETVTRNCTPGERVVVPVVIKNGTATPTQPAWARQGQTMAGLYKLPKQPKCSVLMDVNGGNSDHGSGFHECAACEEGCTNANRQAPIHSEWTFLPSLITEAAYDVAMMIEYPSVHQLAPFSANGVFYRMKFEIGRPSGNGYVGCMGPQVRGGVTLGDALNGRHHFEVRDTQMPSPDGVLVRGRWLALPGRRRPGDIGLCKRACLGCDQYPHLLSSGLASGTVCGVDVGVMNSQAFVYRFFQSVPEAEVEFDGAIYRGTEWEVNVRDTSTGAFYTLGRVVLEGHSKNIGMVGFAASHEHLGCAPCDAYYQAARVTGPFILVPQGVHRISRCDVDIKATPECGLSRVVGLGGLSLLYESGPGVWPASTNHSTVFKCNTSADLFS